MQGSQPRRGLAFWEGKQGTYGGDFAALEVGGPYRGKGAVDMGTPGSHRNPGFRRQVDADKGGLSVPPNPGCKLEVTV